MLFGRKRPSPPRTDTALADFQVHLDYHFTDSNRLQRALTHRSYAFENGLDRRDSNERLEFLGDSVLGLLLNEFLMDQDPEADEGILTKTKSLLASRVVLASVGRSLDLGRYLRLSENESNSGGRDRDSILADALEALLGALYLDGGLESARALVRRELLARRQEILADESHRNYKSFLQEKVQSLYKAPPRYRVGATYGPDHSKDFLVEVIVQGKVLGTGRGRSKKDAEQDAAKSALDFFEDED